MTRTPQDLQHLSRNPLALALTAGLHVIAVMMWMRQPHLARPPAQPEVVSILLRPAAPAAPESLPPAAPASTPLPHRAAPMPAPVVSTPVVSTLVVPALPKPAEPRPSEAPAPSPADTAPAAPPTVNGNAGAVVPGAPPASGFDMALARRQARRLADDAGPRAPRMQAEGESRWTRLNNALEAAHVAPLTGVQLDSYTAADGTIIYRKRIGNRTVCRRSGDTGSGGVVSTGGNGTAGWVSCPNNVEWKSES